MRWRPAVLAVAVTLCALPRAGMAHPPSPALQGHVREPTVLAVAAALRSDGTFVEYLHVFVAPTKSDTILRMILEPPSPFVAPEQWEHILQPGEMRVSAAGVFLQLLLDDVRVDIGMIPASGTQALPTRICSEVRWRDPFPHGWAVTGSFSDARKLSMHGRVGEFVLEAPGVAFAGAFTGAFVADVGVPIC